MATTAAINRLDFIKFISIISLALFINHSLLTGLSADH